MRTIRSTEGLSAIKFRELETQHRELAAHYDRVEQRLAGAGSGAQRLRILFDGLAEAHFAGLPLHGEVSGLEGLLLEAAAGTASKQTQEWCLGQLRQALEHGRQRAKFAHLFGCVLEEWETRSGADEGTSQLEIPGQEDFAAELLQLLSSGPSVPARATSLESFFSRHAGTLVELKAEMKSFCDKELCQPVARNELRALLKLQASNPLRPAALRDEARAMLSNDLLIDDYAGALTVIINRNLDTWRWPEQSGNGPRLEWRWERWRAYFDGSLLTTLLLEVIGWRLAIKVKALMAHAALACVDDSENIDSSSIVMARKECCDELFLSSTPTSLDELSRLGDSEDMTYEGFRFTEDSPDTSQQILTMIAADVKTERAASSEDTVYAVHTDVKDYFPTIPNEVVEKLFNGIGLTERWQRFLRRFIEVPLPTPGSTARRGIPLGYKLSYMIGDLLLRVLDAIVFERTKIRLVRFIDDIYFVTNDRERAIEAWKTIEGFCDDCGLSLNRSKSGAVAAGTNAELPQELPEGPFVWGAVQLTDHGAWAPHHKTIKELILQLESAIGRSASVLEIVAQYNGYLNQLIRKLGPFSLLHGPGAYLDVVTSVVAEVHRRCLGGQGICAHVCGLLRERFATVLDDDVSDALLYWPVSAGGLGLCNPLLVLIGFQQGQQQQPTMIAAPTEAADGDWRNRANPWSNYYRQQLRTLAPVRPQIPSMVQGLRRDFMRRANVRSLTTYWDWVIASYGSQLVQRFGAFSVLFPQLVPMQLVIRSQKVTSSLDEEMAMAPLRASTAELLTSTSSVVFDDDDIPF